MQYRREIDGLRAIAVLPVLLFHAGIHLFSGGFVGVDVFFVISGYLITALLIADLERQKFSLLDFYERRARRILPALFVVLIVCVVLAWIFLLPSDTQSFAKSLIAVSLFGSNFLFWRESGYFDSETELKPLLHTWSLAVEEQYYVFFPVLLFVLWRYGRQNILVTLALLWITSLSMAQWLVHSHPSATFYLLPTRAWELLLGSFVAFGMPAWQRTRVPRWVNEVGGVVSLMGIVYAIFGFDHHTPMPSVYALVPTLGAVGVILFAQPGTTVGLLLGSRWLVGIGLISYSLYLWHQPLFAFARHVSMGEPSMWVFAGLMGLTFGLAYLTWRFVETPLRDRRRFSRRHIGVMTAIVLLVPMLIGGLHLKWKILASPQFGRQITQHPAYITPAWPEAACPGFDVSVGDAKCQQLGSPASGLKVVVWGDSHALALSKYRPELDGVTWMLIGHSGCPPLLGVHRFDRVGHSVNCADTGTLMQHAQWINAQQADVVILVGRWSLYQEGWKLRGQRQKAHHFVKEPQTAAADVMDNPALRQTQLRQALERTLQYLQAPAVYVLDQPMDFADVGFERMLGQANWPKAALGSYNLSRDALLSGLPPEQVWQTADLFCDVQQCVTQRDRYMLYDDDNHLSPYGAQQVWTRLLMPKIETALSVKQSSP